MAVTEMDQPVRHDLFRSTSKVVHKDHREHHEAAHCINGSDAWIFLRGNLLHGGAGHSQGFARSIVRKQSARCSAHTDVGMQCGWEKIRSVARTATKSGFSRCVNCRVPLQLWSGKDATWFATTDGNRVCSNCGE